MVFAAPDIARVIADQVTLVDESGAEVLSFVEVDKQNEIYGSYDAMGSSRRPSCGCCCCWLSIVVVDDSAPSPPRSTHPVHALKLPLPHLHWCVPARSPVAGWNHFDNGGLVRGTARRGPSRRAVRGQRRLRCDTPQSGWPPRVWVAVAVCCGCVQALLSKSPPSLCHPRGARIVCRSL